MAVSGGEADKLTSVDDGVSNFAYSPDGRFLAFTMIDPVTDAMRERERRWGDIRIEDQDQRYTNLYVLDLATRATRQLTKGNFVVGSFDWSTDAKQIAYDHRVSSDAADSGSADISIVDVATGRSQVLVGQDGPDANPHWSPDGTQVAFVSAMAKPAYFYLNNVIAIASPASPGTIRPLSEAFDEDPSLLGWTKAGIHFSASQHTWSYLFTLDPATMRIAKHAPRDAWIGNAFSLTPDGVTAAFVASGPAEFPDVFVAPVATMAGTKVSNAGTQIASWPKHAREVFTWKSQDGATIEGVLHKPAGFQAGRRYPLLIVIHGGPTAVSRPVPYSSTTTYPIDTYLAKGAIVLEPNYRGSAGYGEAFR